MLIHGLQKMTLLDFPGHVACTVFLGGCDFRCPYCHNYELIDGSVTPSIDEEDFFSFLKKRKGLLDGVAITGGEPLLRKDLKDFIERIHDMDFLVKLDTNGYHPEALKELLDDRLVDYVAMDVKNSLEKYAMTTGLSHIDTDLIKKSISIIINSAPDYEFRTTVVSNYHEASDFDKIGELISGAKAYFLQKYTERDTVHDKTLTAPSDEDMKAYLVVAKKYIDSAALRGI